MGLDFIERSKFKKHPNFDKNYAEIDWGFKIKPNENMKKDTALIVDDSGKTIAKIVNLDSESEK